MSGLNDEEWAAARRLMKNLAHDLNNLISPLFLYSEMLQESLADPALKQRAEAILQRSQAMKTLVDGARWIYREDEDAEQHAPAEFFRRLSLITRPFFQQSGAQVFWVVPTDAGELEHRVIAGRFILAEKVRRLAEEAAGRGGIVIILSPAGAETFMRAYAGEGAALAATRYMLAPSAVTLLPGGSIEGLLASLSGCEVMDVII